MEPAKAKDFHLAIVDDSEIIRSQLAKSIVTICASEGHSYQLFQVNRGGQLSEVVQAELKVRVQAQSHEKSINNYYIYTAPTYRLALRVLDLPILEELTLLCDLSVPADTQVGLVGLLDGLVQRKLPVNLIFISSDFQNRASIEPLLKKGKAYFIEKGTPLWDALPEALVSRASRFNYHILETEDLSARHRTTQTSPFIEDLTRATVDRLGTGSLSNSAAQTWGEAPPADELVSGPAVDQVDAEAGPIDPFQDDETETGLVGADELPTAPGDNPSPQPHPDHHPDFQTRMGSLTSSVTGKLRQLPDLLKKTAPLPRRKEDENNR